MRWLREGERNEVKWLRIGEGEEVRRLKDQSEEKKV